MNDYKLKLSYKGYLIREFKTGKEIKSFMKQLCGREPQGHYFDEINDIFIDEICIIEESVSKEEIDCLMVMSFDYYENYWVNGCMGEQRFLNEICNLAKEKKEKWGLSWNY